MTIHKQQQTTTIILTGLFIFGVILMMYPSYTLLVKPRGEAFDLFWIWAGGQAVLQGDNPYGPETTRIIQVAVFGDVIPLEKYQHGFPHPAHIAFVLFPFIILPFSWSVLLWVALQIPMFFATALIGLNLLNWPLKPIWLLPLFLLASLGYRYPINIYVLGQLTFFVMFCFVFSTWLYQRGRPRWAAVVFACATIRPDLALFAILLTFYLIRKSPQRNQFVLALVASGLVMAILPMFFIGFWPLIWLKAILSYGSNPFATWPPGLLPAVWQSIVLIIALLLWISRYIILEWRKNALYSQSMLVSAAILTGLMILPQTGSYTLTLALISAFISLRYADNKWLRLIIGLSLLTPWIYFSLSQWFEAYERLIFLLVPAQFILFMEVVWRLQVKKIKENKVG